MSKALLSKGGEEEAAYMGKRDEVMERNAMPWLLEQKQDYISGLN